MKLMTLATHTLDIERLTPDGFVLDAGCRDFDFTREMLERGQHVMALDPAPDVPADGLLHPRLTYMRWALVGAREPVVQRLVAAGNGSRLTPDGPVEVTCASIGDWHKDFQRRGAWNCVKLDIEGGEYAVLLTWPGPVARQITVEYHEHTGLGRAVWGADVYRRIAAHLGLWYTLVKDDPMDTLWVLR